MKTYAAYALLLALAAHAEGAEISIAQRADLQFGRFATLGSAGAVTVHPGGARAGTGLALLSSQTSAAMFELNGDPNTAFSISLPTADGLSDGTTTLSLDNFQSMPSGTGGLDANGSALIYVGATLHVPPATPVGAYSGSIEITVNYE